MATEQNLLTDRYLDKAVEVLSGMEPEALAQLLSASADVVLLVDAKGVIVDLAFSGDELIAQGCQNWRGKTWSETVTVESQPKVEALLNPGKADPAGPWRHINHTLPDGNDLPLAYSVVQIAPSGTAKARTARYSIAFARDLRPQVMLQQRLVTAQLSMERDYWRLRQAETRYRLLFQLASEPVLILDGALDKITEINPAAQNLLGEKSNAATLSLSDKLEPASLRALRDMLERLRSTGRAEPVLVRLKNAQEFMASASQFREDQTLQFLLRLCTQAGAAPAPLAPTGHQLLASVMEQAPDAMAVTDLDGRVLTVNRAFVDLAELGNADLARGVLLDAWLGRSGVDLRVLLTNLRQHGTVRLYATQMRGELGSTAEVEISAVAITNGPDKCLGFTIRDMCRRLSPDVRAPRELPRSASQMTELVGRMPLKDIVRETTDLIEQLCIEAALQLTGDNRASAAEMLGLSRQSLYIKLRRFDLVDGSADGAADPVGTPPRLS
jgi:transcriptional regulator PpsR